MWIRYFPMHYVKLYRNYANQQPRGYQEYSNNCMSLQIFGILQLRRVPDWQKLAKSVHIVLVLRQLSMESCHQLTQQSLSSSYDAPYRRNYFI